MNKPILTIEMPGAGDGPALLVLAAGIELFDPDEVACVAELWDEYQRKGDDPDPYYFLVAREDGRLLGFACYGHRPLTDSTYDLYWIAVDRACRGQGVGLALLRQVEAAVRQLGGRLLIVETSGLEKYASTRRFYARAAGYPLAGTIRDFYAAGDDLYIYAFKI